MKILDKKVSKDDILSTEDVGLHFLLFRKAIQKTRFELAGELGVSFAHIVNIEDGKAAPGIAALHYLYTRYSLNINWLLTRVGHMFVTASKEGERDPVAEKYGELLELMQVPAVEEAVNAALTEIRALMRLEDEEEPPEAS